MNLNRSLTAGLSIVVMTITGVVLAACGDDAQPAGPGAAGAGGTHDGEGGTGGLPGGCLDLDLPGAEDPAVSAGRFKRISANAFTCGIDEDDHLVCWGETAFQVDPPQGKFKEVSTSICSACAIDTEGQIVCWGCPPGDGGFAPPSGRFASLSMGFDHVCAIRADDGSIACSGSLTSGLPDGAFEAVASARGASCGIVRGDGAAPNVRCWGSNDDGRATPPGIHAIAIGGGSHHFCAIDSEGELTCWGMNGTGQTDAPAGAFRMASGTCGLRDDLTPECWGGLRPASTPEGCFLELAAGSTYACGIRADGHVVCWGSNVRGEAIPP